MKYLDPSFSSRPSTPEYRDGWERTFGKDEPEQDNQEEDTEEK